MSTRRLLSGALILAAGVAIGVLASRWNAERAASAPPAPTPAERAPHRAAPEAVPAPPADALPPEAKEFPEEFADLKGEEEPEADAGSLELPVLEKLVREPLSEVRHQVIGAWDDARESDEPGRNRAFMLVVAPDATDQEIETLGRDVLARHGDAGILDVRIYDDEDATKGPRAADGGQLAFSHLVGQVLRNEPLGIETIRVRGRLVEGTDDLAP
jgi:hypothetical protein